MTAVAWQVHAVWLGGLAMLLALLFAVALGAAAKEGDRQLGITDDGSSGPGQARSGRAVEAERRQDQPEPCDAAAPTIEPYQDVVMRAFGPEPQDGAA